MEISDYIRKVARHRSADVDYKVNMIVNRSIKKYKGGYRHYYVKARLLKTPLSQIEITIPLGDQNEVWDQYKTTDKDELHELVRDEVEKRAESILTRLLTIKE